MYRGREEEMFQPAELEKYDFSKTPEIIRMQETTSQSKNLFKEDELREWNRTQKGVMHLAISSKIYSHEYVEQGKNMADSFFGNRGNMKGNVLDVGGSVGRYREWWEPEDKDVYIVHDPGVEGWIRGPHDAHRACYKKAFDLPMTFVEGFAEALPYKDGLFDVCLMAQAMDHFVDPDKAFREAVRCLKKGTGTIILIQSCGGAEVSQKKGILRRIIDNLKNPKRLISKTYHSLFFAGKHLHDFTPEQIVEMLKKAGFNKVEVNKSPILKRIYFFEASVEIS
jgi:SAM-dependent methyltransferase